MKSQYVWFVTTVAVLAFLVAALPSTAQAATGLSGQQITVAAGRTINDDVYATGSTITIDGRINGNLVAIGQTVTINGIVTGSVTQAAANSTINGTVGGSVTGTGGTMTVNGRVAHDVTFGGGTLTLASRGYVGRDLAAGSGSVTVDGRVGRNVQTSSGSVTVGPTAYVGGRLTYTGNSKPKVASGATVRGPIQHQAGSTPWTGIHLPLAGGFSILGWLRTVIGFLAFGLLLVFLAPVIGRRGVQNLQQHPFSSFGWGAMTLVGGPIVALLAFILGLVIGGWWIALITLALYGIGLAIGVILAGLFVGRYVTTLVAHTEQAQWISLSVGIVLLLIVSIVPGLGGIILALATIWGLGALVSITYKALPFGRPEAVLPASPSLPKAKAS